MSITNLGRVQGGGFFYSSASSSTVVSKTNITPNNIPILVDDHLVFPNGDVRTVTSVNTSNVNLSGVVASLKGAKGDKGDKGDMPLLQNENGGFQGGLSASAITGGAIGKGARVTSNASIKDGSGGAVGELASAGDGGAIGYQSSTRGGGAIGQDALSINGGAIGFQTRAGAGGAIGEYAGAGDGFSGGSGATVKNNGTFVSPNFIDAIQLGTGTNNTEKTLQVYNHTVMNADGTLNSNGKKVATKNELNSLSMFPDIKNYEGNIFKVQSGFQIKKNLLYDGWVFVSIGTKKPCYCFLSSRHQSPYTNYFTCASISAKMSAIGAPDEYDFEAYVPVFKGEDISVFIMNQPDVEVIRLTSKYYRMKEV